MAMMTEKVWAALDSLLDYAKNCDLLHPLDETFAIERQFDETVRAAHGGGTIVFRHVFPP